MQTFLQDNTKLLPEESKLTTNETHDCCEVMQKLVGKECEPFVAQCKKDCKVRSIVSYLWAKWLWGNEKARESQITVRECTSVESECKIYFRGKKVQK